MSDWNKVKDIFQAALEKSAGAEREVYLNEACGAGVELRGEVLALLASFEEADDFLSEPPIAEVADEIVAKAESFAAGQRFGRYRIERKLGAGGAGEVFLARDVELERHVALKILSAEFSGNPDHARRFVQEARAASALNHPNILTIYESGQIEDVRFIAAEYVAGETLRARLRRAPRADIEEIFDVIAQTAAALNAAHRAGIVHRDIKPENIMIRADGLVKVLDFGLAKLLPMRDVKREARSAENEISPNGSPHLTAPGIVMGTVAYMSPEQARGLATDERTDVWSVGVCLSEMFFGAQPFVGETASDQIAAILRSEPEPQTQDAPAGLRRVVEKCLQKKVENRYQSIDDFMRDFSDLRQEFNFTSGSGFYFSQAGAVAAAQQQQQQTSGNFSYRSNGGQTGASAPQVSVSSAQYVAGEIKKHKIFSLAAVFVIIAALCSIPYYAIFKREKARKSDAAAGSQAYQLYLNGILYRRQNGPENVRRAVEYQKQAIQVDPQFASAYAELALNYYNLVADGVIDSQSGLPRAREAIEKALALDDSLANAHDVNASLKAAEYDWAGADAEIRRAVELDPNLAAAHTYRSELLSIAGRFDEALAEIRKARLLDPLRINLVNYEAEIFLRARRYDDALKTWQGGATEAVNETFGLIARARVASATHRPAQALALVQKSLAKDETTKGLIHLGRIYAVAGKRAQALAILERLKEIERRKEPDKIVSPAEIAILYAALGMREVAFENLERAYRERDFLLPLINVEPEYQDLRGDACFADLLRRINLKTSD
jgi:serine/threonine protein kinase